MGVKALHSDVFWLADNHYASYLSNQSWHWKQSSLACTSFSAVSARPKYFFRTSSWRKALQSYVLRLAKKCHATFLSNQNWNWKQSSLACTSFPALGAHFIHKVRILIGSGRIAYVVIGQQQNSLYWNDVGYVPQVWACWEQLEQPLRWE